MRPLILSVLTVLNLLSPSPASAQEEAAVNGIKKSEWIKMLEDSSVRKRRAAVVALGVIGPLHKDVVPALGRALRDKEVAVRTEAIQVLSGMKQEDVRDLVPDFADLVKEDASPAIRQQSAQLLGRIGPLAKPAVNRLVQALADKDTSVRVAAAEAIGRIGPDARESAAHLVPLLKDRDPAIRLSAIFSLGRIGVENEAQLQAMAEALRSDASVEVRREAARSLGLLEESAKPAIPNLMTALKEDKSADVRQQAALALAKFGILLVPHKDALLRVLKADADRTVRIYVLRTLGAALENDVSSIVAPLCEVLKKEPEGDIRLAVVQELGNGGVPAKAALPTLLVAQQDVQITVRDAAKVAVKKINEAISKAEIASRQKAVPPAPMAIPEDANAPVRDLRAGGDANKRYFLIGPRPSEKAETLGLLVVLPGGAGDEQFLPFVRGVFKEAVPKNFLVVQLVAPKWQPKQEIVWPNEKTPVPDMKFTTNQFIDSAIAEVEGMHKIDSKRIYTLSWSSGGPAAYDASLTSKKIKGSLIAMSVFKPQYLPDLAKAKDARYYLLHSAEDAVCPYGMAKDAVEKLTKAGAKIKLVDYEGEHGWPGNSQELIYDGLKWLGEGK